MNRFRSGLIFTLVALTACSRDAVGPASDAVESVIVTPAVSTVSIGAQIGLTAQVLDETGTFIADRPVHWASANESIATVSSSGVVTARKIGTVQVAASTGGRSGLAQITVTAVPVNSIQIAPGNKSLLVGESFQFTATTRDASGGVLTGRPVAWSSNNESVVTVSASGLATALAPGGAIVTATSEGKSSPASVTVAAIPVASVVVQPTTQSLVEGQTAQIRAQPMDVTGKPLAGRVVLWSTSNAAVATVTSTGVVTAQSPGNAVITATSEGKSGTSAVTVTALPPNAVVVTPAQVLVQQGATSQLSAQVLDSQGRVVPNSQVTFSSSDNAIATVSSSGLVSGVAPGKVTISATSAGLTGTAQVTVTPIPVGRVVVTPASPTIAIGTTITLSAQALSASGQPLTGRTVVWSSSLPSIASVSAQGVVTGLAAGNTVVFASIDGVLGWVNVTVIPAPVATVTISPSAPGVAVGDSVQLNAVLKDASGNTLTGRVVSWSSGATSIATVTNTGMVTGVAAGTAVITATSEGQVGTVTVTVTSSLRTVTVTPDTATIAPLGTVQLTAVVRDASGTPVNTPVAWSSDNNVVAQVNSSGKVTGLVPGTAIISAKAGSATGTATITVK
jgi:uncharacterized protein YjdB